MAGALLMELTLGERIELAGESGEARKGTVVVRDGSPTADDLLDEALATLGRQS
ncbi:MAG TPA: GPP34 family phosphoprotein [Pedococcus sp.]|nr:GPP34 family phosphoprotein [Pedococcus sp.]